MESIIQLSNVTKTYRTDSVMFNALKDINLQIEKGKNIAIVGKSGSGKSTLLNMITGIDQPTQGTIHVNGTEIGNMNESKLAKWRGENIGIVFQFFQLIPTLTIRENLLLAMEFVGVIPKAERWQRGDDLLALVGIAEQAEKMPASLSGGQQQRAAIARALANNPQIVVADEPTGNLDSKTAESVYALFSSLAKSGKTVIVVTHEKDVAVRFDHIVTVSDGEIVIQNPENQVL